MIKSQEEKQRLHLIDEHKFFHLGNNPEIAEFVGREDMKEFLVRMLFDIEFNNYKEFLVKGHHKYFQGVLNQLKNSYRIIKSQKEDERTTLITEIERSYDRTIFTIGEQVYSTNVGDDSGRVYFKDDDKGSDCVKIGRMYINRFEEYDVKIRLDYINKPGTITWRKLNCLIKKEEL